MRTMMRTADEHLVAVPDCDHLSSSSAWQAAEAPRTTLLRVAPQNHSAASSLMPAASQMRKTRADRFRFRPCPAASCPWPSPLIEGERTGPPRVAAHAPEDPALAP